jgi:hypothetical protein
VGGSDTVRIASAAAVNRDNISGFTAGAVTSTGQADVININTALGTLSGSNNFASAAAIETAAAGAFTAVAGTEVIRVTVAAIADATSANSLNGTNLLAAQGAALNGAANGSLNVIVVGITGGGTAVYYANSGADAVFDLAEITLVGVLSGVAVADLVFSNFSNVA